MAITDLVPKVLDKALVEELIKDVDLSSVEYLRGREEMLGDLVVAMKKKQEQDYTDLKTAAELLLKLVSDHVPGVSVLALRIGLGSDSCEPMIFFQLAPADVGKRRTVQSIARKAELYTYELKQFSFLTLVSCSAVLDEDSIVTDFPMHREGLNA